MGARIRLLWLPQAQFAGYLLAARENRSGIVCQAADFSTGPIEALLRGDCEFAVASPAHVLESPAPSDLVWLLTIQQVSPLVYPIRKESGIGSVRDLAGRRVAVWPGNEDLELQWMMARAGLGPEEVERVPVTDTVAAFLDGTADCAQMTCYHEIHHLEAALGTLEDVRLLKAADQGIGLIKDGLITRRDLVELHGDMVQDVVHAVLAGWTRAFAESNAAIEACLEARPDMDRAEHARQLEDIRTLAKGGATLSHGLGYPDPVHADNAIDAARETGLHEGLVPAASMVMDRFWHAVPAEVRRQAM